MSRPAGEPNRTSSSSGPSSDLVVEHPARPSAAAMSGRFSAALSLDDNKPDSKGFPDFGSPVSPLAPRGASAARTSSSSSSSGSVSFDVPMPGSVAGRRSHSGELSGSSETSPTAPDCRVPRPTHRRIGSGPLIFSRGSSSGASGGGSGSGSSASSPITNALPTGNICPSGRIAKTELFPKVTTRNDVLGSGTGNYGHGSIIRGGAGVAGGSVKAAPRGGADGGIEKLVNSRRATGRADPEEVTKAGNECYKKGQYAEALRFYDRAVILCPDNAACRSNRAAALMGLGRIEEAARESEEAVRLDPANGRGHHRLACIKLRLGQVEIARKHLFLAGQHPDPTELHKLQTVERHLMRCGDARKMRDWKSALREADAAIAAGADSCQMLSVLRVEALLHLHRLDEADSVLSSSIRCENPSSSPAVTNFINMLPTSYFYIVRAQLDMALGRFDDAVQAVEKARQADSRNMEVLMAVNNVKSVARARAEGNELYKSGNFAEACASYAEGLKYNPSNPVLLCNRAACRSNLGQLERSIEDCNEALRIQPNYTKALLRRADSNFKLEHWAEAVRDYESLRKELPGDGKVAEGLFHAQLALKMSRGEEVSNMKFGGEVEEITTMEQFQAAISLPGVSVVYFVTTSNQQCSKITPFVDTLCTQYPSTNFLKVDINQSPAIAKMENVRIVPTFKIYKDGIRVKEIICPSQQVLENSMRHYGL